MYLPTPTEVAVGHPSGRCGVEMGPGAGSPRAVLERVVRDALLASPCVVAFSGGRDSSAVLAVAAHVARREGLPLPVPVTLVYPDDVMASENPWQERVLSHLGLEGVRIDGTASNDLLGPRAQPLIRRYGPLWPPLLASKLPLFEAASCGVLLNGDGGDEVLGAHRSSSLAVVLRRKHPLDRRALKVLGHALSPAPLRERQLRARRTVTRPWLRPDVEAEQSAAVLADEAREPLSLRRALHRHRTLRAVQLGLGNVDEVAAQHRTRIVRPLLDPRFIAAYGRASGPLGPTGRGEAMTRLFGDLLPAEVLQRTSKAYFNGPAFGRVSRDFAREWDGDLDEQVADLVRVEELQRLWGAEAPVPAGTFMLLQHAWARADRRTDARVDGDGA